VILVSGASCRIGLAIATHLKSLGYCLGLRARDITVLQRAFGDELDQLHFAHFDAEQSLTIIDWVALAMGKFGRIDGLVSNAGVGATTPDSFNEGTQDELDHVMRVNMAAPWELTKVCVPHLEHTGSGQIIYINSLSGLRIRSSSNLIYMQANIHSQLCLK
jgi:NADP-dependent 3-hydroxy acid dehydrogenase YdfG